jgi:DNA-binding transcriptional regulator PaaX
MSSNARSTDAEWLILVYRIPSLPTSLRARVLRRLHRIGAVPLQRSVVTLPYSSRNERALRIARHEIESTGGVALLSRGRALGCHEQLVAFVAAERNANKSSTALDVASGHKLMQRRATAGR